MESRKRSAVSLLLHLQVSACGAACSQADNRRAGSPWHRLPCFKPGVLAVKDGWPSMSWKGRLKWVTVSRKLPEPALSMMGASSSPVSASMGCG